MDASRQAEIDARMIELGWHGEQGKTRRQCDSFRKHGSGRVPLLILWTCRSTVTWRRDREYFCRADDEHHQWRGARRQQCGFQEFMRDCRSEHRRSPRPLRWGARAFHALKSVLKKKGL